MKSNFFVFIMICMLVAAFDSCITVYLPVAHQKEHTGQAIKKIELEGQHIGLLAENASGGQLLVSVIAEDVLKASPARLTNLKISLAAFPGSPGAFTLERIDFHHTSSHSGKTSLQKSYSARAMNEDPEFILDDDGFYTIAYIFSTGKTNDYPKKFTCSMEGTISSAMGTKDFHQVVDFKKTHHFSIFH